MCLNRKREIMELSKYLCEEFFTGEHAEVIEPFEEAIDEVTKDFIRGLDKIEKSKEPISEDEIYNNCRFLAVRAMLFDHMERDKDYKLVNFIQQKYSKELQNLLGR